MAAGHLLFSMFLAILPSFEAAYCGASTIPYSFEVLPDGSTSLGCARPSCFGYEPGTGNWASQDSTFEQFGGHSDGFLRSTDPLQRPPFFPNNPQTAMCFTSVTCLPDQWAAGYNFNNPGFPLICCAYPPLSSSQTLGIAALHPGEITVGGENPGSFDYIRNIQAIRSSFTGAIERYDVEMGRMSCIEPIPVQAVVAQPQQEVVAPAYYQPTWGYQDFRCFTGDSEVTLSDGSTKRMDELAIGDWVNSPKDSLDGIRTTPVESWLHRLTEKETQFIVLKTTTGKELKLTENHYLYRTKCNSTETIKPEMVRAADVSLGDCLLEAHYETNIFLPTMVTAISTRQEKGIYAPLTDGGKIIVNGLMASCFSDTSNEVLVHSIRDRLVNCDSDEGLDSLQCSLSSSGVSLLLDMVELSLPAW